MSSRKTLTRRRRSASNLRATWPIWSHTVEGNQALSGYMEQQGGRQQLLQQQLDVCRKPMERAECERFCMPRGSR